MLVGRGFRFGGVFDPPGKHLSKKAVFGPPWI